MVMMMVMLLMTMMMVMVEWIRFCDDGDCHGGDDWNDDDGGEW